MGRQFGHGHAHTEHEGTHNGPVSLDATPSPEVELEAILQTLRVDPDRGAVLALRFLEGSPPPFHAQRVLAGLDSLLSAPSGYDVALPPEAPENRKALERIRGSLGIAVPQ